eukprot:Gb_37535 [translate_table: standard]
MHLCKLVYMQLYASDLCGEI